MLLQSTKVLRAWMNLSKEKDVMRQVKHANLCHLRLSDMGITTLGVSAPPYDEIAQEAFSVWELFENDN